MARPITEPNRGLSATRAQQWNLENTHPAPGGGRPLLRCISLDLEVTRQGGRIRAFAGVRPDTDKALTFSGRSVSLPACWPTWTALPTARILCWGIT